MISCRWILIHMGYQVAVEVPGILEPHKFYRRSAGEGIHAIAVYQVNRRLTIDAQHRLVICFDGDTDRGAFRQDDRPVDGEVRRDRHDQDIA